MQYRALCSSSCSGQGYCKLPVRAPKWIIWSCVLCLSSIRQTSHCRVKLSVSISKKLFVQEALRSGVCLTKMAQGRRPACCCLSEECLLSGGKKREQGAKSHIGLKRSDSYTPGSERASLRSGLGHSFWIVLCQQRALESVRWTVLSFANTKLAVWPSRGLLIVTYLLFIYLVPGACPLVRCCVCWSWTAWVYVASGVNVLSRFRLPLSLRASCLSSRLYLFLFYHPRRCFNDVRTQQCLR